ncbi:hypothetical protein [Defluviitalea raffinosedens]|uniref:Uncharacterized protein n=1 Tax=Defluviitalea raffinosedens TaxID=1450156 RepID=A0A7C8HGA9_9FIRM|nr:hypothetical protein [Defluviitalea raffinosedens]KAE9630227.1 hypothetical protein GND95_12465 [Defluviitalea raffinosedens]MBM7686030.1 hypothetical protein [Defluviitalea raffinosedens]HHW67723.1 hypothetical protein [Candidatus Epulonipiscium sp.]
MEQSRFFRIGKSLKVYEYSKDEILKKGKFPYIEICEKDGIVNYVLYNNIFGWKVWHRFNEDKQEIEYIIEDSKGRIRTYQELKPQILLFYLLFEDFKMANKYNSECKPFRKEAGIFLRTNWGI